MARNKPTWDDRARREIITIWDRWQPACDSCGRLESSLKERLMSCSYCGVAKYCSDTCQKHDWSAGSRHKERCHLYEIDRKLSDVHFSRKRSDSDIKCFGPGIDEPNLTLREKAMQWSVILYSSRATLKSSVMQAVYALQQHRIDPLCTWAFFSNSSIVAPMWPPFFVIDKVALMPWVDGEAWSTVTYSSGTTLPPGFDLHRLITHINRGITHFHGSFWPLPRRLSDAAFTAAEPPPEWLQNMRRHAAGFLYVADGLAPEVLGIEKRDGTHVPLYKFDQRTNQIAFDSRLPELAKIDTTEFKKLLDDPSRKFSISVLLAIAIAAPAYAAVVARIEGDITGRTPFTWLSYEEGITYKNETARSVVARTGSEVVTCYGFGTAADRTPIISVIDDWCGRVIGTQVTNSQTVWARYDYGTFTVLVSGEAINGCNFVIDGNCNRLLREPVDQCNTGGENGKQGGYETDLCGQWRTDPGSNGSDV
ncbi:hypothetical protein B0H13DRAFT_2425645 [Mycena leptocephala]|nr:hypothetical protein B0H13DRAFT_2425645 [Mycena leptocephala]